MICQQLPPCTDAQGAGQRDLRSSMATARCGVRCCLKPSAAGTAPDDPKLPLASGSRFTTDLALQPAYSPPGPISLSALHNQAFHISMKPCVLAADALYAMLLHATKYPTSAVSGLLLGTTGGEAVEVTQALPMCHSFITLTPMLEAAMAQAEVYAKEQQASRPGLRLVGYYQCNERLADADLGAGRRVADRVEAACSDAVALVLDGAALEATLKAAKEGKQDGGQAVFQLFCKDGARGWVKAAGSNALQCTVTSVAAQLAQYAGQGRHHQLHDFEEHLESVDRDWLNPGLLQGPA